MDKKQCVNYTKTDEAPALATLSLLPIVKAFTQPAGIDVVLNDISLAGRILANFADYLTADHKYPDYLAALGELAKTPEANIIKLPNISASVPQLKQAIAELQSKGYAVPDFPEEPANKEQEEIKKQYAKVLGSAVNPVLREGNSDRRVAGPVKQFAKDNPHSMGEWSMRSKTHVAHMQKGDFFSNEQSTVIDAPTQAKIELVAENGQTTVLKNSLPLLAGEVIDATYMSKNALCAFYEKEIADAKDTDVLLSLHLKATMMKVSDPVLFGHCVTAYFKDAFEKHAPVLKEIGVDPANGLGDIFTKIQKLPDNKKAELEADLNACLHKGPRLAMVNSDKGITNLHVPSDVIIDASMPAAIRVGGKMWGADGTLHDTKALIPDRCYAGIYKETINFCKENGAFDVTTMGNVANVGLMAKKAEEYGSHDKTFIIPQNGTVRVSDVSSGKVFFEHTVQKGDIWRMCQTKDIAIKDWVKLAVARARATGAPAVFWLNKERSHDAQLIEKVNRYLPEHDTAGLEIHIMPPIDACRYTLERAKKGLDTISVTGNVLRDYLTDLFPILELGTSAKMLSIVPLLAGGGLYETGAGGSAPKHVQQFVEEGHLRWDSLGEFLALAVSLEDLALKTNNTSLLTIAKALDAANGNILKNKKSPSYKVNELDNRGVHFYLALYWAQSLASQSDDPRLKEIFAPTAKKLADNETVIMKEIDGTQGAPVDLGGYYFPDTKKAAAAMRPSNTFNEIIGSIA